jgi:hypothetical protein
MRGTAAKALRKKAKQDVLIATTRDNRKEKVGETEDVYRARKKAYKIIKQGEPKPKLKLSRRQKRRQNVNSK